MPVPREVIVYTKSWCGYCTLAKALLDRRGIPYETVDVTGDDAKRAWLVRTTGRRTLPQIFIDGRPIGGYTDLVALDRRGALRDE